MKIFLLLLLIFSFSYSSEFEKGINLFFSGKLYEAKKILCNIQNNDYMFQYADYYCQIVKSIDEEPVYKHAGNLAIDNYKLFFFSKIYMDKNPKRSYTYLKKVDKYALHKEDLPEYYYVKYTLEKKLKKDKYKDTLKALITEFSYDDIYGFPLLKQNIKNLSEREIYKSIDKLISHRKFKEALFILEYLKDSDKKHFYTLSIYLKLRKYQKAENVFYLINKNSKYYPIGLYKLTTGLRNFSKQKYYFYKLKKTYNKKLIEKANFILMKKAFFKEKWQDFKQFSENIKERSLYYKDKIWLETLYRYKVKDYIGAYILLSENKNLFSASQSNYWLYLISKKGKLKSPKKYLILASKSKSLDFYSLYSKKLTLKFDITKVAFKRKLTKENSEKDLKVIKKLKQLDLYKWAYTEGKYYLKKYSNIDAYKKLYFIFPELTAKKFALKQYIYESFPKPFKIPLYRKNKSFEQLVFSVMRQESFFDYYAVSPSKAIGVMQIIPPTAKWIAKMKKFDLTNIDLLFNPQINIDFGSWYLSYLIKLFDGNLFYAVASYNAGPGAVRRFLAKNRIENVAEFIEFFPYEETRNYVKKVMRNYFVYSYLIK